MDKRELEKIWGEAALPVAVFIGEDPRPAYENLRAAQLTGGDLLSALPPGDAQALRAALAGQEEPPFFCHLSGEVYSAVLVPQGGCTACLLHRVTGYYNRTQNALNEAVMASRAKTNFLSEMSHDIRTPMGAIVGLTDIALTHPDSPLKIQECLEKIKVASGHMMSLLNEVLDMSRIESGRIVLQEERANVGDLLHEILVVARPQADAARLDFRLELGPVDREDLMLDAVRLKQVCLNLLSNAIKYTPAGGRVDLYLAVEAGAAPDRLLMTLRVEDTGLGMSPEFLEKLFSPFEREKRSAVYQIQGTGLGMSITKNLVELMGGSIQVESQLEKGSCFTAAIPFRAAPGDEGLYKALSGKRALLLEADCRQAETAKRLLGELGMCADWAKDADSLVAYINDADLAGEEYYVFLCAESIPGAEVTLLLPDIRRRLGGGVPILLLADSDWSQIEYLFTRSGVDSFVPLPLFKSRLAAAILSRGGAQDEGPQASPDILKGRRLLLAEDNELNREIAVELLQEAGAAVECAENGLRAVEMFAASSEGYYDAVLMDVQMPELNGLDATRRIRGLKRRDAGSAPIVAMTANAFVEDVKQSLDAGMNAHISKPLDMDRLFATLDSLLGGART